jgi:membrane-associated phospholipid phosphatase
MNLENWSSFPSDNAAMWFALSFGLWKMSRPAGIVAVLYSTLWVCLPRLYLGAHYPSDLAVGALLGWTTSWLAQHMPLDPISNVALRLERTRPYVFYPAMFLASYEMAAIFEDVRLFMRAIHQMHGGHIVIYVLAGGFVLCIGAAAFAKYMKLRTAKVAAASYIASTSDKMSLNGHHS